MKQIWSAIQAAFTAVGGFLGWYLGGLDGFLYALIVFVAADYITGVLCAIYDKTSQVKSASRASPRRCSFLFL